MSVRAKFKVARIERSIMTTTIGKQENGQSIYGPVEVQTIVMSPIFGNSSNEENNNFFAATPSGEIKLGVVSQVAAREFELNKEYYVDFTVVE